MGIKRDPLIRIISKIEIDENGCWIWKGRKDKSGGYAQLTIEGKATKVHRYVYSRLIGELDKTLVIDHLCRVRHCINPEHLEQVTFLENVNRGEGISVINSRKLTCPQGHTYSYKNNLGNRRCRICDREAWKKYKKKRAVK